MKNNKLEKLFQKKLGNLQVEPSGRSKSIFEEKISRHHRLTLLKKISVAASIILLISAGLYFIIPDLENSTVADNGQAEIHKDPGNLQSDSAVSGNAISGSGTALQPGETGPGRVNNSPNRLPDPGDNEFTVTDGDDAGTMESDQTYPFPNLKETGTISDKRAYTVAENSREEKSISDDKGIKKIEQVPGETANLQPLSGMERLPLALGAEKTESFLGKGIGVEAVEPEVNHMRGKTETKDIDDNNNLVISIEYIPSGTQKNQDNLKVKELYDKMNNLVYPEEVLGDIRSFKDQLFAFEFIKERKGKNSK